MSDEEYEYDYGSDNDYNDNNEYDYGSDDQQGGDDIVDELIEIENSFYEGDDIKTEDPRKAIENFEKVVRLETQRGDQVKWRFKALQNLVILYYQQNNSTQVIDCYQRMLSYLSQVTRNECTEAINVILDAISGCQEVTMLSSIYEMTLVALKTNNNDRLWFTINLKLARVYLQSQKFSEVDRLITLLKQSCLLVDGTEDPKKMSHMLEIYCVEMQLCALTGSVGRMKMIYPKTQQLNAAVADPRVMGIIREEGGKMRMAEGEWLIAYNELFEAFRNYQEAGNPRAKDCLKYVVLASMLALSDINPFAAREAKVFADHKEIVAMSELRSSLEANDLERFEKTLNNRQNKIIDEPFLMTYIQPLRRRMKEQVLVNLVKPYRKTTLQFLGDQLAMSVEEIEALLVDMIQDDRLSGARIDQVNGVVTFVSQSKSIPSVNTSENSRAAVLVKWGQSLVSITESIEMKLRHSSAW